MVNFFFHFLKIYFIIGNGMLKKPLKQLNSEDFLGASWASIHVNWWNLYVSIAVTAIFKNCVGNSLYWKYIICCVKIICRWRRWWWQPSICNAWPVYQYGSPWWLCTSSLLIESYLIEILKKSLWRIICQIYGLWMYPLNDSRIEQSSLHWRC